MRYRSPIRYGKPRKDSMESAVEELVNQGAEALAYKILELNVELELKSREIEKLKEKG